MSQILFFLVALLLMAAGAIFFYNMMPDFEKLKLSKRFDDKLGAGREAPGIFTMFRLPILILEDFASELKVAGLRKRYGEGIGALGLEEMVTVDQAIALKISLTLVMALYGGMLFALFPIAALVLPIFGWFFMDIWFIDKVKQRKAKIKRELPFVLDTLTLSVEAGLEFTQGMDRIVSKMRATPLRDELTVFLRQMQLGTSRRDALKNLAQRTEIREVGSLVSALIQASEMGSSIGGALRIQSELMSAERFMVAEKKGAEASQKMLIPMMLFIVPAIMMIILGPIAVQWVYGLT